MERLQNQIKKCEYILKGCQSSRQIISNSFGVLFDSLREKLPEKKGKKELFMEKENPILLEMKNLSLPIFGTFRYNGEEILIHRFENKFTEFVSLARPKSINIIGTDGKIYTFMLKSTEDLRCDQRKMIFFRFLNQFLRTKIRTYSVTPLTVQFALLQFVKQTKSLGEMVKGNREKLGVINIEEKKILELTSLKDIKEYNDVQDNVKIVTFSSVIAETPGRENDLRDSFYSAAPNGETWTNYLVNFSKSCAVTSIVDYIIGIGDRHPNNILISLSDGWAVHIYFTDCFKIDQRQSNNPENVPFRLTRNMVAAFGPCNVNGTFRSTCEETLAAIRENRELIFNILEVFYISPIQVFSAARDMRRNMDIENLTANKNKFIMKRIKMNLDGTDKNVIFKKDDDDSDNDLDENCAISVKDQVEKLISHATDNVRILDGNLGFNIFSFF